MPSARNMARGSSLAGLRMPPAELVTTPKPSYVTYSRPAANSTPSQPSPPDTANRPGSALVNPKTTKAATMANSIVTTKSSDLPTNLLPMRLTTTTVTIRPMPIALADQSGVCHGSSARTYPAKPAQEDGIAG